MQIWALIKVLLFSSQVVLCVFLAPDAANGMRPDSASKQWRILKRRGFKETSPRTCKMLVSHPMVFVDFQRQMSCVDPGWSWKIKAEGEFETAHLGDTCSADVVLKVEPVLRDTPRTACLDVQHKAMIQTGVPAACTQHVCVCCSFLLVLFRVLPQRDSAHCCRDTTVYQTC